MSPRPLRCACWIGQAAQGISSTRPPSLRATTALPRPNFPPCTRRPADSSGKSILVIRLPPEEASDTLNFVQGRRHKHMVRSCGLQRTRGKAPDCCGRHVAAHCSPRTCTTQLLQSVRLRVPCCAVRLRVAAGMTSTAQTLRSPFVLSARGPPRTCRAASLTRGPGSSGTTRGARSAARCGLGQGNMLP